jgi:hypothetical protein
VARFTLLLALLVLGCGDGMAPEGLLDPVITHPELDPIAPNVECTVTTGRLEGGAAHTEPCTEIVESFHPPAIGQHFRVWADFGSYPSPVPWGFLTHSLEHGAIVLAHNCENACPEVLALFETLREETEDPLCRDHPNGNRIIVVPDPELETPIAAVAWGHVYTATCLDEVSLRAFVTEHYAQAPENFCNAGTTTPVCP